MIVPHVLLIRSEAALPHNKRQILRFGRSASSG
jgi:hypothetical protein